MSDPNDLTFGPVPSRRLGRSLGVNNIPPKSCSYSCLYCQVGPTRQPTTTRRRFHGSQALVAAVREALARIRAEGQGVDYLTFVPDGEPTLDVDLGETLAALRPLGVPIAVISNASLISRADVRRELAGADLVSLKVDSVDEERWRRINQPAPELELAELLAGIERFAADYSGTLLTETMLLAGINDDEASLERTASFLARVDPATAYLARPTRPPADARVRGPDEEVIARAYERFVAHGLSVELLVGYEEEIAFPAAASESEAAAAILAITAVHPMREVEALQLLADSGADRRVLDELVDAGELRSVEHEGALFYLRSLPG